jgi:uncharacterized protein YjiK
MKSIIYIVFFSFLLFATACNKDQALADSPTVDISSVSYKVELLESILLDVAEPSGLSWALNHKDLLVVDDRTNRAYIIDTKGKELAQFPYHGDDTEGVTIDTENKEIWIAEEADSELIHLDSSGNKLNSFKIDINRDSKKKGLEGLTFDAKNKTFYILNEGEPGLLIKWKVNTGIESQKQLQFAQDYSGIFFDNADQSLWIVSDQSQKLFYCDLDANVKQSFDLDYPKAEGVVVDIANERLYIVSDSERKLFIYKIKKS